MPPLLLATLIITAAVLVFAILVVCWMVRTAVHESPESDPERDAGRTEAQITADADRTAAAIIRGDGHPVSAGNPVNPVLTLRRVCAWCQIVLQEGTGPTTHGICPTCSAVKMAEIEADWATSHPATRTAPAIATL